MQGLCIELDITNRAIMADATTLLTSFSLRLRYHTGGLRWGRASRVWRKSLGKVQRAYEVSVPEPAPLIKQHPPFTRTQTDRGLFIIRTFSPDCLSNYT